MKINSGMILSHPSIFDVPLNLCSNGCVYCFACNKNFKFNQSKCINAILRILQKSDFVANRVKEGYPITISNISDMFCESNIKSSPYILDLIYNNGIDIYFQTKTSLKMLDIVKNHVQKKQIFYVTITTNNDEISKLIEPNAPTYSERFYIVQELLKMGHGVQIGINPTYYGFMDTENAKNTMNDLLNLGVDGFVIQYLHLNKHIKESYKKYPIIGADVDKIISKSNINRNEHFFELMKLFHPYIKFYNQPTYTKFWDNYNKTYKALPTCQSFSNYCIDKYGDKEVEIGFEEYYEVFKELDLFLTGYNKYDEFIISSNRFCWINRPENQNIKSPKDLIYIFFKEKNIHCSPSFNEAFDRIDKKGEVSFLYKGGKFNWRKSRNDKDDIKVFNDKQRCVEMSSLSS
jgi:DNA repair photolyase